MAMRRKTCFCGPAVDVGEREAEERFVREMKNCYMQAKRLKPPVHLFKEFEMAYMAARRFELYPCPHERRPNTPAFLLQHRMDREHEVMERRRGKRSEW